MKPLQTFELKTLLINGLPAQVRKQIEIECHATQRYREKECGKSSMGEHCLECDFCEASF